MEDNFTDQFEKMVQFHEKWVVDENTGARADVCGYSEEASMRVVNFSHTEALMQQSIIPRLSFERCNMRGSDFSEANMDGCTFVLSDFSGCIFNETILSNALFYNCNFSDCGFARADLTNSHFMGVNITGSFLSNAVLRGVKADNHTSGFFMACPEEGSFIGYKKASSCIVKLLIPGDAERSSATTRKCRCSKAVVLSIESISGIHYQHFVYSDYDGNFIYTVGETVSVPNFDKNRWEECSTGIHFFITRDEAVLY